MFIATLPKNYYGSSGAGCSCYTDTSRSAGARFLESDGNYEHLVPPGPKATFAQRTITPL